MDNIEVIREIPRCEVCKSHADYWIKNKKTGESKYFCSLCSTFILLKYRNNGWDIISFK